MPRFGVMAGAAVVVLALGAAPPIAAADSDGRTGVEIDMGQVVAGDPHRMLGALDALRTATLGSDVVEIWSCTVAGDDEASPWWIADLLERSGVADRLETLSDGSYRLQMQVGGSVWAPDPAECSRAVAAAVHSEPNAALIVVSRPVDGAASSARVSCRGGQLDFGCDAGDIYPANGRRAIVPLPWVTRSRPAELLHELGHTLGWPHVLDPWGAPYGTDGDVMSGLGTLTTAAVNRYAAGWIPEAAIAIARPDRSISLGMRPGATELLVVPTTSAGAAFTVEYRDAWEHDPTQSGLGGIYVHIVDERPTACGRSAGALPCLGTDRLVRMATERPLGPGAVFDLDPASFGATGLRYRLRIGMGVEGYRVKLTPLDAMWCEGERATIVGTSSSDTLRGTSGRDIIVALDGDDIVRAGAGDDVVCGGSGDDLLIGGSGADLLVGGTGDDVLRGGRDRDRLLGGPGGDRLLGRLGNDQVDAGAGADVCRTAGGTGC